MFPRHVSKRYFKSIHPKCLRSNVSYSCMHAGLDSPDVNSTMAFRQEYSAASTWMPRSFSIWSVNTRILSMNETMRSEFMWFACIPAVASNVGLFSGIGHCAAFNTNSSLQVRRSNATWSVTARSGNNGIFLAHSTAENNNLRKEDVSSEVPAWLN